MCALALTIIIALSVSFCYAKISRERINVLGET